MKIDKKSTLYKIGAVVFIVLVAIYTIYTGSVKDDGGERTHDLPFTEMPDNASGGEEQTDDTRYDLIFRNEDLLKQHYEKHGIDMGFKSAAEYAKAANEVLENEATLHKVEAEDGDDVYYLEQTNEFVVVSKDGYIRTYFNPDDGIDYFNRQ